MARRSTACRRFTATPALRDKLVQLWKLSEHVEHENSLAVCRSPRGGIFTAPFSVKAEKWREGGIIRPDYSEMITPLDDPCEVTGNKMVGSVHTHPKSDPIFSEMDLEAIADEGPGCILYRKEKDLRLKCTDYKGPKKFVPQFSTERPEEQDPTAFAMYFKPPCDISVSKTAVRKWRLPWRTY